MQDLKSKFNLIGEKVSQSLNKFALRESASDNNNSESKTFRKLEEAKTGVNEKVCCHDACQRNILMNNCLLGCLCRSMRRNCLFKPMV